MNMFEFEIKKIWKQKKLLLLVFLLLIGIFYLYMKNDSEQETIVNRTFEKTELLNFEVNRLIVKLETDKSSLSNEQLAQLEQLNKMRMSLYTWRNSIYLKNWKEVPKYQGEFLATLSSYLNGEGEFEAYNEEELEKAIQKNNWLLTHNLPYEDEQYPISPHLTLLESSFIFLGIIGLFILLIFFGGNITSEIEQNTWLLISTQPLQRWKVILSKYCAILSVIFFYAATTALISLLIPYLLNDYPISMNYPYILEGNSTFHIISILDLFLRLLIMFSFAGSILFSLHFFIGSFVQKTFSSIFITIFLTFVCILLTKQYPILQTDWNPFQHFFYQDSLEYVTLQNVSLIFTKVALWSCLFLFLTITNKARGVDFNNPYKKPFKEKNKRNSVLLSISSFEWRKLLRKGTYFKLVVMILSLISVGYIYISNEAVKKEREYFKTLDEELLSLENLTYLKSGIDDLEERIRLAEKDKEDQQLIQMYKADLVQQKNTLVYFNTWHRKLSFALDEYKKGNYTPLYDYQHYKLLAAKGEIEGVNSNWIQQLGVFTLDVSLKEKEWLLENNIKPVFSGVFLPNIHTKWIEHHSLKGKWEEENTRINNSGLFSLFMLFKNNAYLVPAFFLLLMFGTGFAGELEKKNTLNFLSTQPISPLKILIGKILHSVIVSVLTSLALFSIILLIGTLFGTFGDWNYPVLYYDNAINSSEKGYSGIFHDGHGAHFITLGEYLVQSIILFILSLIFFLVLSNILSIFFKKNKLTVLVMTLIFLIMGYTTSRYLLSDLSEYSPFTYLNINQITNGELSTLLNEPSINSITGSFLLIMSTILLLFFVYVYYKYKNK